MKTKHLFWVYYLSLSDKLPEHFFKLSHALNKYGIMFLPIKPNQLKDFTKEQDNIVIVSVVTNLNEQLVFQGILGLHLKYLLMNKKIRLVQLSSFAEESLPRMVQEYYEYSRLPMKTQNIASIILKMLYNSYKETQIWPGGKRAKLPA
jgi:hypothetical protein